MRRPVILKTGLFILLFLDALIFFKRGDFNDGFDSLAWLVLMALYQIDMGGLPGFGGRRAPLRWVRSLAVLGVVLAESSYLLEGEWLDTAYSSLWLLVAALFEFESRYPACVSTHPRLFRSAGVVLILGMSGIIGAWLLEPSYFDAYDGVLWSLAFLTIDLDLLASAQLRERGASGRDQSGVDHDRTVYS